MPNESKLVERTGYSRQIREQLRQAREEADLTQEDVAELIAKRTGESVTPGAISHWETFRRHPRIDEMAVWARALGLRLNVSLDREDSERVSVLLSPATARLARAIEAATPGDRRTVRTILGEVIALEPED